VLLHNQGTYTLLFFNIHFLGPLSFTQVLFFCSAFLTLLLSFIYFSSFLFSPLCICCFVMTYILYYLNLKRKTFSFLSFFSLLAIYLLYPDINNNNKNNVNK